MSFAVLLGLWGHDQSIPIARHFFEVFEASAIRHPWLYILVLAFLPLIGMPVTPLYILGGLLYGFPYAFFLGVPAILLNLLIVFGLCQKYLRPFLIRFLIQLGHKPWQVDPKETWRITLLVRATPGPPIFLQSYLLCLAAVPLTPFLTLSWPIECIHLGVFSFSAGSAGDGHWGLAITGLSLIAIASVLPHFIKKRYGKSI